LRHPLGLAPSPFEGVRLLFLVIAVIDAAITLCTLDTGSAPALDRLAGSVAALALAAHWVLGFRRGGFPLWAEPLEAAALFVILRFTPGEPFLPLFGLVFRSLYGGPGVAALRYLMWMGVLIGAHAHRGQTHINADLARALGTSLVPTIMQALGGALRLSEASQRRLRSLVQNSTDVMTVVGADLRVRWQAESILGALGLNAHAIVDHPILELVHTEDRDELERYFADADGTRAMTLRLRHTDGSFSPFDVVASDRRHDESVEGFVLNLRDATERVELERELRALAAQREHDANHDPLTGLANRRKLFARIESAIAEAKAGRLKLPLLLIDLDHFKELNDTLGHQAGDRLLREIGPRLEAAVPGAELVARVGGDEFAVLATAPVDAAPDAWTARWRQPLVALATRKDLPLSVSVGLAQPDENGQMTPEDLLTRADTTMYTAKRLRKKLLDDRGTRISGPFVASR
jgi:diguanylate cyclase (GGDEF)-like protein/PAS domain S-box-containing protein